MRDSKGKSNGAGLKIALVIIGCLVSALLGADLLGRGMVNVQTDHRITVLEQKDVTHQVDRLLLETRVTTLETFLSSMSKENERAHAQILEAVKELQKGR